MSRTLCFLARERALEDTAALDAMRGSPLAIPLMTMEPVKRQLVKSIHEAKLTSFFYGTADQFIEGDVAGDIFNEVELFPV